jgi:hypothetical protein
MDIKKETTPLNAIGIQAQIAPKEEAHQPRNAIR